MEIELAILTITGLITFSLGINILLKFNKEAITAYLSGVVFSLLGWIFSIALTLIFASNIPFSLYFSRSSFEIAILIAIFLAFLAKEFHKKTNLIIFTIFILIGTIFIPLSFSEWIVKSVEFKDGVLTSSLGFFQPLYSLVLATLFIYSFVLLFKAYRESKDINIKEQIKYILFGGITSLVLSFISNLILPLIGIEIRSLGPLFVLIFVVSIFYAIRTYRFLNIKIAIGEIINVIVLSVIPIFAFYFFIWLNISIWKSLYSLGAYFSSFIESLLFIYIFFKFQNISSTFIESKFSKNYFKTLEEIQKLNYETSNLLDFHKIIDKNIEFLKENLNEKDISLIKIKENIEYIYNNKDLLINKKILKNVYKWIIKNNKPYVDIIYLREQNNKLYKFFLDNNIEIIYPYSENVFLILFEKDNHPLSKSELDIIIRSCSVFQLGIMRSTLYEKEKNFTHLLEQKVREATNTISEQKDKIEDQYRQERDMIGILGHELRTPLTTARGFLEMTLKDSDNKGFPETLIRHIEKSYEAVKREADIVQTMLSTSHLDNDKLTLNISEVNLDDVIKTSVQDYINEAHGKGLELEYHPIENLPTVKGDPVRTIEITTNLISNAVKYTQKGRIDVSVSFDSDYVHLSVRDTGEGIPQKDITNIGKKFFRVGNYLSSDSIVRPGGTGLGMYVVKGILEKLGGTLEIESELGKGSTFTAIMPIWKGQ